MGSSSDETDVDPGLSQPSAEVSPDPAASEDRDSHRHIIESGPAAPNAAIMTVYKSKITLVRRILFGWRYLARESSRASPAYLRPGRGRLPLAG